MVVLSYLKYNVFIIKKAVYSTEVDLKPYCFPFVFYFSVFVGCCNIITPLFKLENWKDKKSDGLKTTKLTMSTGLEFLSGPYLMGRANFIRALSSLYLFVSFFLDKN